MNQEKEKFAKMLTEVANTTEIIGVDKLTELLKNIQKSQKEITEEEYSKANTIIKAVCDNYSISIEEFFSNKRKNNRRYAIGTVCYILNKIEKFDYEKISFVTNKPFPIISVLIKEISEMSITHPFDKKILNKLEVIKSQLKYN